MVLPVFASTPATPVIPYTAATLLVTRESNYLHYFKKKKVARCEDLDFSEQFSLGLNVLNG